MHIKPVQKIVQKTALSLVAFSVIFLLIIRSTGFPSRPIVHQIQGVTTGNGGKWHIPRSWIDHDGVASECKTVGHIVDITDAAACALHLAFANEAFIDNSNIPLIAHQTSRSADPKTWSSLVHECVEKWLAATIGLDEFSDVEMAWFMWDDAGVDVLVQEYEPDFHAAFTTLAYPVEKADAFRVLVLKWFGGVYGDIDSKPLTHPSTWVQASDLDDWIDGSGNKHGQYQLKSGYAVPEDAPVSYTSLIETTTPSIIGSAKAVNAIFGIEADNLPDPDDTYWRMGYTFPVQITNWALAMSPHHPVANLFLSSLAARIQTDENILPSIDPLDLTGPPALTQTVKDHTESAESKFSWQSLSSRNDSHPGGRAKIVAGDVLVLPITGFSPGRGRFRNMGSQPTSHPSARLVHLAAGSWRKADVHVTYGKLCRTLFGLCRDWSKIPVP